MVVLDQIDAHVFKLAIYDFVSPILKLIFSSKLWVKITVTIFSVLSSKTLVGKG